MYRKVIYGGIVAAIACMILFWREEEASYIKADYLFVISSPSLLTKVSPAIHQIPNSYVIPVGDAASKAISSKAPLVDLKKQCRLYDTLSTKNLRENTNLGTADLDRLTKCIMPKTVIISPKTDVEKQVAEAFKIYGAKVIMILSGTENEITPEMLESAAKSGDLVIHHGESPFTHASSSPKIIFSGGTTDDLIKALIG